MSHLIQPIEIASVKRCFICQTGKTTAAFLTSDFLLPPFSAEDNKADVTTPCGSWILIDDLDGNEDSRGEITFGVTCASSVTLEITKDAGSYEISAEIYRNNVFYGGLSLESSSIETLSIEVPLTDSPCGTRITIFTTAFVDVQQPILVTSEIIAIA
jgi:hypothetical protein